MKAALTYLSKGEYKLSKISFDEYVEKLKRYHELFVFRGDTLNAYIEEIGGPENSSEYLIAVAQNRFLREFPEVVKELREIMLEIDIQNSRNQRVIADCSESSRKFYSTWDEMVEAKA